MSFSFFPPFFESNDYFIDEKVNFFKFENAYKIYNDQGEQMGNIVQKISGWHKFLRLLLNKAMFPFTLEIKDMGDTVLATVKRGWTFWMSKITVLDNTNTPIALISQKFKFFKPTFHITDTAGQKIAEITGDWKAWNFSIKDASGQDIGKITKKWGGVMKEVFTTADKYNVNIAPEVAEDVKKIAIVASAITIDMVLKESK